MEMVALEQIKQQWQIAADAMPQLICLLDSDGRVLRANRTLERWRLGEVEWVKGIDLHDILHRRCSDPGCYLRSFWKRSAAALARDGCSECGVWDPRLERRLDIRVHVPLAQDRADAEGFFAVAVIDDLTESKAGEERSRREIQNELWRLSAQHLTIQESERRRIAGDLHDGLGQTLSLVKLSIEEAARAASAGIQSKTLATLERLAPTVKTALAELRRISMNLRPATLDDLGILATLAWYFREFEASWPHIHFERDISVKESDVPEPLKIAIFRIVQEATSNALKHAQAERIKVSLNNEDGSLELLIEDTGRGFDPEAAPAQADFSHGLGLQSMRERAELSGARYAIHSAPGKGTSICVRWPSPEASERKCPAHFQYLVKFMQASIAADPPLSPQSSQCLTCMICKTGG